MLRKVESMNETFATDSALVGPQRAMPLQN
jgi:hypothetical protein